MATCQGQKTNNQPCGGSVYRCKRCGNVGCGHKECRNYAFEQGSGKCIKCGSYDKEMI